MHSVSRTAVPLLSFGTCALQGDAVREPLRHALKVGYRSIDTAARHDNETQIGEEVRQAREQLGLDPLDVFVTTKLAAEDHGAERAFDAVVRSYERLGMGPIDLLLIERPEHPNLPPASPEHRRLRLETWHALVRARRVGLVRHIGVSNYAAAQLEEIRAVSPVRPAINQVECHPLLPQHDLRAHCRTAGIQVQAHTPFGGRGAPLLQHPAMHALALLSLRTRSRMLLRWSLDLAIPVVAGSSDPKHITDNLRALRDRPLPETVTARLDELPLREGAYVQYAV